MFVLLTLLVALPVSAQQVTADEVARRAFDVMAGPAWEKARYIAFSFNAERDGKIAASWSHRWDRYTGDYRVSGKDAQGNDLLILMNINTRQGRAWQNGAEVKDAAELLKRGYGRFINDTYWLLMPLKALDPGVKRELAPSKTDACGRTHDVVRLSFDDGVGLTPGDVYWMHVNRDTGLVDEWLMKLQNMKAEEAPTELVFRDYRRFGNLLLSTRREIRGTTRAIVLGDIEVMPEFPRGAFRAP